MLLAKAVNVFKEYANFLDVFSKKSTVLLSDCLNINKPKIDLKASKQPPSRSIYNLGLIGLKNFKTYIEGNLANKFIRLFKSSAKVYIFFVQKPYKNFCLCINYRSLNYLIIKNWYPLPLIKKLLDWLKKAKQFTQLNLTNVYHCIRIKKSNE